MKTVNNLGALAARYGGEPPEGRKSIQCHIDFSVDQTWHFEFLLLQQQKAFSNIQQLFINPNLLTTNSVDIVVNGVLTYTVQAGGAPVFFPILANDATTIEFQGGNNGKSAGGTLQVFFLNFAASNLVVAS